MVVIRLLVIPVMIMIANTIPTLLLLRKLLYNYNNCCHYFLVSITITRLLTIAAMITTLS